MDDPTPTVDAPSMPRRRFFRLRIAVSMFFGLLTVALCVLWVRSYCTGELVFLKISTRNWIYINQVHGMLKIASLSHTELPGVGTYDQLNYDSAPASDCVAISGPIFGFLSDGWAAVCPYWFLVALTAWLSVAPWHKFHFSLRTLLIATTLVAVGLGLGVWAVR